MMMSVDIVGSWVMSYCVTAAKLAIISSVLISRKFRKASGSARFVKRIVLGIQSIQSSYQIPWLSTNVGLLLLDLTDMADFIGFSSSGYLCMLFNLCCLTTSASRQEGNNSSVYYYSTLPQLYDLVKQLDPVHYEKDLCIKLSEALDEIARQMAITLELTRKHREALIRKIGGTRDTPDCYLDVENCKYFCELLNMYFR